MKCSARPPSSSRTESERAEEPQGGAAVLLRRFSISVVDLKSPELMAAAAGSRTGRQRGCLGVTSNPNQINLNSTWQVRSEDMMMSGSCASHQTSQHLLNDKLSPDSVWTAVVHFIVFCFLFGAKTSLSCLCVHYTVCVCVTERATVVMATDLFKLSFI